MISAALLSRIRVFCVSVLSQRDIVCVYKEYGTAVAQWLRCCVTNRKDAGSIPAGVRGFLIDIKSFR